MRGFSAELIKVCRRKLNMLHATKSFEDLKVPPENRLEDLKGGKKAQYSGRQMMKFNRFLNAFHPSEILMEEFLERKNISQRKSSEDIGWSSRKLNEIIKGKRGITAETAIDLSEKLGTAPEFWLNLQLIWELDKAYEHRKAV